MSLVPSSWVIDGLQLVVDAARRYRVQKGKDEEGDGGPVDEAVKICGQIEFPASNNDGGSVVHRGALIIGDGP